MYLRDMKKFSIVSLCAVIEILLVGCLGNLKSYNVKWSFETLDGWIFRHQDTNSNNQCDIRDGILKIYTRLQSKDRKKICTVENKYTSGSYRWHVYIPQLGIGD